MKPVRAAWTLLLVLLITIVIPGCRKKSDAFVIAVPESIVTLDPMGGTNVDLGSERVRQLMFNSLIRKNEKFEYVGELASNIETSTDGLTVTFTLRDGVKFHNGKALTAADAKYTLDWLLSSSVAKAASFFEGTGSTRQSYITSVEAPDARTLVIRLRKPWLQLLVNLVPIGIIPDGTAVSQKEKPIGSGPFEFVRFDLTGQVLDLVANEDYWEGKPQIRSLRVISIRDANALQAELLSGRVDCAPNVTNLTPDTFKTLAQNQDLKIQQFPGANIVYLGFNTRQAPLDNVRFRQAIAFAIDRESIIRDLLLGQAKIAHSILPAESWAYVPGQVYTYDPEKSKKLLDEIGYRDPDGDGPRMRLPKPIVFKMSGGSVATRQYGVVIQDQLKKLGIPVEIETLEAVTLTDQQIKGDYQMITRTSVGGNHDPIFLRDLFATSGIPTPDRVGFNRTRYSNPELDLILEKAVNTPERDKAKEGYAQAQEIVSRDLPMMPLWYASIMVVARSNVANIKIKPDGDWIFVKDLTVQK
ncbi:MAG: ABC transporter substrate-binding protein [Pyrinomonadaceae bacterium]